MVVGHYKPIGTSAPTALTQKVEVPTTMLFVAGIKHSPGSGSKCKDAHNWYQNKTIADCTQNTKVGQVLGAQNQAVNNARLCSTLSADSTD